MARRIASFGSKRGDTVTLKASGAETASTSGAATDVGDAATGTVTVDVTAVTGTSPTALIYIEGSHDGGTTWHTLARVGANGSVHGDIGTDPTNLTAAVTKRTTIPLAQHIRSRSVIGGTTPSFTYSVTVETNQSPA